MYDLHTETSADIYRRGSMWAPYYIYSKTYTYCIAVYLSASIFEKEDPKKVHYSEATSLE
jgi:hypothetical protein